MIYSKLTVIVPTLFSTSSICIIEKIISALGDHCGLEVIFLGPSFERIRSQSLYKFVTRQALSFSYRLRIYMGFDCIYSAMNAGARYANGEWLFFCGDTDCPVFKNIFRLLTAAGNECNIISASIKSHGQPILGEFTCSPSFFRIAFERNPHPHQATIYKKSVIEDSNIYYPINYKVLADYAFNLQLRVCRVHQHSVYTSSDIICEFDADGISSRFRIANSIDFVHIKAKYLPFQWLLVSGVLEALLLVAKVVRIALKSAFRY